MWYIQVLTTKLGMAQCQDYVTRFDYKNKDLTGDKGKGNGLTQAWLSSSLQISITEQLAFLQKMLAGYLPMNPHAVAMTKKILYVQDLSDGWTTYGKTDTGNMLNADDTKNPKLNQGWLVCWMD